MNIRPAKISDMSAIHSLVYELAVYEKEPEAVITTAAEYEKDFSEGVFRAIVAENEWGVVRVLRESQRP